MTQDVFEWKIHTDAILTLKACQHARVNAIHDVDVHCHWLGGSSGHPEAILELVLLDSSALDGDRGCLIATKRLHNSVDLYSLASEDHILAIQRVSLDHTYSHIGAWTH
jgi:hypothetical protein